MYFGINKALLNKNPAPIIRLGNENKTGNALFMLGIIIELTVMMTDHFASWTIPFRGRLLQLAFAFFCIKILTTGYSVRQWMTIVTLGLAGTVSYLTCGDEYIVRAVVLCLAAVNTDMKRVLKLIFWGSLAGTALIVSMALAGIAGNVADVRDYGRGAVEARYCLGFNHANNVHGMFAYLLSLYVLIRNQKIRIYEYICMTLLNAGLYFLTISRTGALTSEIIILLALFFVSLDGLHHMWLPIISCISMAGVLFLTLLSSIRDIYHSNVVKIADKLLTGRMELTFEFAGMRSWSLLGTGVAPDFVDNGFAAFTYKYGIVMGVLLVVVIMYAVFQAYALLRADVAIAIIGCIIMTFMESTFVFNSSLLCNMLLIGICTLANHDGRAGDNL